MERYWEAQSGPPSRQQQDQQPPKRRKPRKLGKSIIIALVALVILVALASMYYLLNETKKLQDENERLSNPTEVAKQEVETLVSKIGAVVDLPADETPTLATVSDVNKLREQSFFVDAENGDKVLIYPQAKKAYLYRPSTNKVINIAPVNLGDQPDTTSQ